MKKSSTKTMELGNLMFGNSRGTYAIPRKSFSKIITPLFDDTYFDMYGYCTNRKSKYIKKNKQEGNEYFENDVFIIRPYYWGENESLMILPNFVYKPTNLEISWYKYPLRDSYSNQNITLKEFKKIIQHCITSIN